MATTPTAHPDRRLERREEDQRVFLHNVTWEQYEDLLGIRGDAAGPRMTYLEGELELMSPSIHHEGIKKTIARLLEIYALERGLAFNGYGSWTLKKKPKRRGLEPDECYVLGTHRPKAPDLAIEVDWTPGGLDKIEVYRGLGVREVWTWKKGRIQVQVLRGERYVRIARSELLPEVDLERLAAAAQTADQTKAVREFQAWLRKHAPKIKRG